MLISRTWLGQLLDTTLPDDDALAATITSLGLEVEAVTRYGAGVGDVVVGKVVDKRPHPEADKLTLVTIEAGGDAVPVVCGASNVPEPGGRVAFAPVGAVLVGDFRIEPRKIRGERSEGMICSETELDIGSDGDGILVLPADFVPGARLVDVVPGIVDTVFELSITPNRPDALGHVGVARDLAIKLGARVWLPTGELPLGPDLPELVTLQAPARCGRYFGYALEDAQVGPSPLWLRVRLHRLGLRAISNVVDITNLVLMEWGQPLHAFDRARLAQGRVVVRTAEAGETIETLDGQTLELRADDLVIADAERPQALAGVMGAVGSGVEPGATRLLLEAAWFDPAGIRQTARHHQILTDSSHRFERGVDHDVGLRHAAGRAAALLVELTGAKVVGGHEARGTCPEVPIIRLRPDRITRVLGMEIPTDDARRILDGLEVVVDATNPKAWSCRPPTHRPDLQREEDLIEEVMRHHGLDELPAWLSIPTGPTAEAPTAAVDPAGRFDRRAVDRLVDALAAGGLHETISLAFADPGPQARVVPDAATRAVVLDNPMRQQAAQLRLHLVPGLLDAAALNAARHGHPVHLFEVGRTYAWGDSSTAPPPALARRSDGPTAVVDATLPVERLTAAILVADADTGAGVTAVAAALDALARLGLSAHADEPTSRPSFLHPGVQVRLCIGETEVGVAGEVHPDLQHAWELPDPVGYAEVWVDRLPALAPAAYVTVPRFPATARDVSIDLADTVSAARVVASLRTQDAAAAPDAAADPDAPEDPPRLSRGDRGDGDVEIVEEYRGEGVERGRRALLLRLHYRARDRSVTDAEVQAHHDRIVDATLSALREHDRSARRR